MKIFINRMILFMVFIILMSCSIGKQENSPVVSKELQTHLTSFMEMNPHEGIYSVSQVEAGGDLYFVLENPMAYDKYLVDCYCYIDSDLVVFSSINCSMDSTIIYVENMQAFKDTIPGYGNEGHFDDRNISPMILKKKEDGHLDIVEMIDFKRDTSQLIDKTGVILNESVRTRLIDFIKENPSIVYHINCYKKNGKLYGTLGQNHYYDPKQILGYFYLEENLVVLYSSSCYGKLDLSEMSFLDTRKIKRLDGRISNYRAYPLFISWGKFSGEFEI